MLTAVQMLGGGRKLKNILETKEPAMFPRIMIILIIFFIIRALIVQLTYNKIVPKITSKSEEEFEPLNFNEALLLTLLVSFLFL